MNIEYLADHPQHIAELAALHFAEWSYLNPGETLEQRINRLTKKCQRSAVPCAVIAVEGAILAGSAALVPADMDSRKELTLWLASVYVKAEYRKQGIGSALVRRIEEEAKSIGTNTLYLYTPSEAPLYEGLGWSTMEECIYKDTAVTLMSKAL
jgi:predicted N-acetyltransferase YhbS